MYTVNVSVNVLTLRLDYGGLGRFCGTQANMYFFSCLLIP